MKTKALIIIDIQNDYFDGGNFPLVGTKEAGEKAKILLEDFRNEQLPVIHIQHVNEDLNAGFFKINTTGVEINNIVKPKSNEKIIIKHYPNSFRETELLGYLKEYKITELVICGMMTNMCVDATVRAACDLGFKCTVISDACAAANLEYENIKVEGKMVHTAFLAALKMAYAEVIPLKDYLK